MIKRHFFKRLKKIKARFTYNFDLITRMCSEYVSLAQPVEHLPFKEVAVGSNPTGDTIFLRW